MNLKEFSENKKQNHEEEVNDKVKKNIEDKVDYYSNFSNDELYNEFLKEVNKGKKNGTINKQKLNEIKETILPFLDNDKRKKLDELLKIIGD